HVVGAARGHEWMPRDGSPDEGSGSGRATDEGRHETVARALPNRGGGAAGAAEEPEERDHGPGGDHSVERGLRAGLEHATSYPSPRHPASSPARSRRHGMPSG